MTVIRNSPRLARALLIAAMVMVVAARVQAQEAAPSLIANMDHLSCYRIRDSLKFVPRFGYSTKPKGKVKHLQLDDLDELVEPNCEFRRGAYLCAQSARKVCKCQNETCIPIKLCQTDAECAPGTCGDDDDDRGAPVQNRLLCYQVSCDQPPQDLKLGVEDFFNDAAPSALPDRVVKPKKLAMICLPVETFPAKCGNGVVDGELGEQCDPPGGGGCSPGSECAEDCTCKDVRCDDELVTPLATDTTEQSDGGKCLDASPQNVCDDQMAPKCCNGGNSVGETCTDDCDCALRGHPWDDVIQAHGGDDVINGLGGNDIICGGDGKDIICGGVGDDRLLGDDGDDTIRGDAGEDTIDAGIGNDIVEAGADGDSVEGGAGSDVLKGDGGNDTIHADLGDDVVEGGAGNDELDGGDGSDNVKGGDGDDIVCGGAGADFVFGDKGNDTVSGGEEDFANAQCTCTAELANDAVFGGENNDTLFGCDGNDALAGDAGTDTLDGGPGTADTCNGGMPETNDSCDSTCESVSECP